MDVVTVRLGRVQSTFMVNFMIYLTTQALTNRSVNLSTDILESAGASETALRILDAK
jgi:hypothetical protein